MTRFVFYIIFLTVLAGCGSGGGSGADPVFTDGSNDPSIPHNGLPFATVGATLPDVSGQQATVILPRVLTDYTTGKTTFFTTTESVNLGVATTFGLGGDVSLTIAGQTLVFAGGTATDADGRVWSIAPVTFGAASATTAVYSYSYGAGANAIDSEGVFTVGLETSPNILIAMVETLQFEGHWFGYGAVTGDDGNVIRTEVQGGGLLTMTADLSALEVGGTLTGSFDGFGDVSATFDGAAINSGAFLAELAPACADCASESVLVGRFYGAGPEDISGLIAFDEGRTIDGAARRLRAPAGFTVERDTHAIN